MTIIWLIVWLCSHTPSIEPAWDNGWCVALGLCLLLDLGATNS